MKVLTFNKLVLTNFLSIGSTPLEFKFQEGLNLITGYDRDNPNEHNGIGKSSICDGLFFALFNETIKDLKMGEIVNDKNKKKCTVELDFTITSGKKTDHYNILRGIKPSICEFKVNGSIDKTLSSIPKTNKAIGRTLGISKDIFKQSIIMSIGKSVSFFSQGKIDKRKFIEGIFNLEIFSEMLSESRILFNDSKKEKENVNLKLSSEKDRLKQYVEKDDSFETNKEEYVSILEQQITTDMEKITNLTSSLQDEKNSKELNADLEVINGKLKQIEDLSLKIEIKLSEANREIRELSEAVKTHSDVCHVCNRIFDDINVRKKIKDDRKVRISTLSTDRVEFANVKGKIVTKKTEQSDNRDAIKIELASIKSVIATNRTIRSHIATLKRSCIVNNEKIDTKKTEVSDFSDLILKIKEDIKILDNEYKVVYKENKVFDLCKFILSEEGVKSVIIRRLKTLLNCKMNEYLDLLGSDITCEFDEYFSETIYNVNRVEKSYDAFSGGESKRIDLAILLTFQDILKDQSGIDIKLGFYDEILDSSIDENGRKNVLRILKDKSEKTPIYIISHRGKMSDLIDNEIILEKHNNFTFLKEIK